MSRVPNISKYIYSISKSPLNFKLFNVNKHTLNRHESLYMCQMWSDLCRDMSTSNFISYYNVKDLQRNPVITKNSSYISNRGFSLSSQILCNTKEKASTVDAKAKENDTEEEQAKETKLEKELNEKVQSLLQEVDSYKDKYQRSLADRENLRQRLEKQIKDSKLFGIQSFCKDLLEVTDVFRKALESVPEEKIKEADPVLISLYDGVIMTETHLLSVFRRHGLQKIVPQEGEKFDPSVQEAMFEVPISDGKVPGTVAHVIRSGWKLHDRCVRSAQVGVVKA